MQLHRTSIYIERYKKMRNFLRLLIVFIISVIIGNMAYGMYKEMSLTEGPKNEANIDQKNITITSADKTIQAINKIPASYKGYKVSAKLKIPKINLETYVFEEYDEEAMWICPTKYFGPNPNEEGNYCIAAHNYKKENMFNHIIELEANDVIYLTDNKNGECKYKVYDIYKVEPTDNAPLKQEANGQVEITLITCSDYSSKRIIVKARKI